MIYHSAGKALKQQTMKFYEDNLPKTDFVRIHRSYIVKVEQIKRIEPYGTVTAIWQFFIQVINFLSAGQDISILKRSLISEIIREMDIMSRSLQLDIIPFQSIFLLPSSEQSL